jgi:hypothetical protein
MQITQAPDIRIHGRSPRTLDSAHSLIVADETTFIATSVIILDRCCHALVVQNVFMIVRIGPGVKINSGSALTLRDLEGFTDGLGSVLVIGDRAAIHTHGGLYIHYKQSVCLHVCHNM